MGAKGFHVIESIQELEDQSIGFAYSSNVLEHIEDDHQTVKDIYPKIMTGGRIVFYVPAFPILYSSMDKRVGHFRRYTKKRLHDVFKQAGFEVEKIFFSDSLGFFTAMLFKFIGSQDGKASKKSLIFYDRIIYPVSSLLDNILSNLLGKNIVIVAKKN